MPARKHTPAVQPLRWEPHCVRHNGWHGYTRTGAHICYVYQPVDMRIRRGPDPWQVHCYYGPVEQPLAGRGRFQKFPSARAAKLAAQRWWRSQVRSLLA